jgi:hypothetical protein
MIDELPDAPDPATDAPSVFSTKGAAFVLAQKNMVPQINAAFGNMSALAAGGAYSLLYTFDSTTTDADPGAGKLRLSSATQNAATVIRLDTMVGGKDVTSILDMFDASTSVVKGGIRLQKVGDPSAWLTFDVTARAAPGGYRNITVTCTGSSSTNPFTGGDGVMLFFQRNGDVGAPGATLLLGTATVGAAVANIDFLTLFSATYDKYVIEVQGITTSTAADALNMRLANAGAVDPATNYNGPNIDGALSAAAAFLSIASVTNTSAGAGAFTIEIRNANDATRAKAISARGIGTANVWIREGRYVGGAVSGFRLYWNGGSNFTAGTVRVYGIKNS